MATQAIEQLPDADLAAPAPKGKSNMMIMAGAGILVGVAAGLFGLGPVLAHRRAAATAEAPKTSELMTPAINHKVENLVLNPAGSGGTRFLMVTATFELKDAATEQFLNDHEAEIRDHILALLGKKTVEELSDITQRERIKTDVLAAIAPLFPKGSIRKVFFPQFVIQ